MKYFTLLFLIMITITGCQSSLINVSSIDNVSLNVVSSDPIQWADLHNNVEKIILKFNSNPEGKIFAKDISLSEGIESIAVSVNYLNDSFSMEVIPGKILNGFDESGDYLIAGYELNIPSLYYSLHFSVLSPDKPKRTVPINAEKAVDIAEKKSGGKVSAIPSLVKEDTPYWEIDIDVAGVYQLWIVDAITGEASLFQ